MQITNKYGLPQTLVNAALRDTYSRGAAHISVTGLIDAPQVRLLKHKHGREISRDVSEMIWAIMGKAVHAVLELGADAEHIAEERLFLEVDGWVVSGQIDLQRLKSGAVKATDYKLTSAFNAMNEKIEWERQLNCYAYLLYRVLGYKVEGLEVVALIRDWSRRNADRDPSYPQAPAWPIPIKLWAIEEQEAYVRERVRLHQDSEMAADMGDDLAPCSDEERWYRPEVRCTEYAVIKEGAKRPLRVVDTLEEATKLASELKAGVKDRSHVKWPERHTRCERYCDAAPWCKQWARIASKRPGNHAGGASSIEGDAEPEEG